MKTELNLNQLGFQFPQAQWWCLLLSDALQLLLFPCLCFIPLFSHFCASELQLVKSLMGNFPPCLTPASTLLLFRESLQVFCRAKEQPQDWKRSVFFSIPKKGNAKKCSIYCTTTLIAHTSKVMLKISQVRLQQYVSRPQISTPLLLHLSLQISLLCTGPISFL